MAFVTSKMWEQRIGRLDDVSEFEGVPVAVARMWGRQIVKRFVGEWLTGDHRAIAGGREFRLSTASVLRWERHPNPASLPLALDGGDALKETIVIERRPSRTELTFETGLPPGSMLHYQPPLTAEEMKLGAVRPPEIVGSYAVYGPMGEKIGHLLRPHATDASGRFEWLDMDAVELPDRPGTWRVRILPRSLAWLGEAAWPVVIDPTFGYTSVGASNDNLENWCAAHGPYTPASGGTIDSVRVYNGSIANGLSHTLGLYDGTPSALLVDTAGATPTANAWNELTPDSAYAISPTSSYCIASYNNGNPYDMRYDSGTPGITYQRSTYVAGVLPNPFPASPSYLAWRHSIYVTYTETAAAGQPFLKRFGGVPFAALNKGVW